MASTKLSIHDAPRALYDALRVKEEEANGTYWKRLTTESIEVGVFKRDNAPSTDA